MTVQAHAQSQLPVAVAVPGRRWFVSAATAAVWLASIALYLFAYRQHPAHPHIGGDGGWWNWFDQSWYFRSASAWATGDLDPELHMYLPCYALFGAVFVPLLSVHAYAAVDLLCLLASLWLFSRIAMRLLPAGLPYPALAGSAIFAATSLGSPAMQEIWVVPWSSSGSAPLTYAALLAALRFIEQPRQVRRLVWLGLAGGAVAAFRPSDAGPIGLGCAVGIGMVLLRPPLDWRRMVLAAAWTALGLAVSVGLLAAAYLAIYGPHESHYVQVAGAIGFEWRALALRWVTLGLSPRPLYDQGAGIVAAFPWLPLGLAGFAVALVPGVRSRAAHAVVVIAATLHMMLYLTFRDLYPEGLFLYDNYHYYKWVIPFASLYCVILCWDAAVMPWRWRLQATSVVAAVLLVLLPWRAQFTQVGPLARLPVADPYHMVAFESGLTAFDDAVLVSATGTWAAVFTSEPSLTIAGNGFKDRTDFKLHPALGGFFLAPLRPLPPGLVTLTVGPEITIDPSVSLLHGRETVVVGRPCWLPWPSKRCDLKAYVLPPALASDGTVHMEDDDQFLPYEAWSQFASGRWTIGTVAPVGVRRPSSGPLRLILTVAALVPSGTLPLQVSVSAGSQPLVERSFYDMSKSEWAIPIPAATEPDNPILTLDIRVANPRRPNDCLPGSTDTRLLGLFISSMRLVSD